MSQTVYLICFLYVTIVSVHCSVSSRSDKVASITPYIPTDWGSYGTDIYCDPGTYAVSFSLRTHREGPGRDVTAVNRVRIRCE